MMMLCAAVSELISCANLLNLLDRNNECEIFMKSLKYFYCEVDVTEKK